MCGTVVDLQPYRIFDILTLNANCKGVQRVSDCGGDECFEEPPNALREGERESYWPVVI